MDKPGINTDGEQGGWIFFWGIEWEGQGNFILSKPPEDGGQGCNIEEAIHPEGTGINKGGAIGAAVDDIEGINGGLGDFR